MVGLSSAQWITLELILAGITLFGAGCSYTSGNHNLHGQKDYSSGYSDFNDPMAAFNKAEAERKKAMIEAVRQYNLGQKPLGKHFLVGE